MDKLPAVIFKEQVLAARERGVDVDKEIESVSVDYQTSLVRLKGVSRGVDIISIAYVLIICAEIWGSFKGVEVKIDFALMTVTCSAVSGLLGFAFGKRKS